MYIIIRKGCKILQKGKKERNFFVFQFGVFGIVDGEDKKGKVLKIRKFVCKDFF